MQVANASFNLPIYFFAGKAFRENTRQLVKTFIPPFILKFYTSDSRQDTRGNLKFDKFSTSSLHLENCTYIHTYRVSLKKSGIVFQACFEVFRGLEDT